MKFLCVPCDQPMRLSETKPPDRGSLALVYTCDACGYEMAMLTNAYETQVVTSLGVKIGPAAKEGSACPFAQTVAAAQPVEQPPGIAWTSAAEARLEAIPSFVRPMARTGIEQFARERGYAEIDEKVMAEARERFGM